MKEAELRKHADCSLCEKPIGASGVPLFWRVTFERFGLKLDAMQRQDGLGALLGSTRLAQVMGRDEDMAVPMQERVVVTVCEACAMRGDVCLAALGLGL